MYKIYGIFFPVILARVQICFIALNYQVESYLSKIYTETEVKQNFSLTWEIETPADVIKKTNTTLDQDDNNYRISSHLNYCNY